jgi:hypothetical protein
MAELARMLWAAAEDILERVAVYSEDKSELRTANRSRQRFPATSKSPLSCGISIVDIRHVLAIESEIEGSWE